MYIERVRHLNHLFLIEMVQLLEKLDKTGLNIEAYIKHILSRIDDDVFGLFIAWDSNGLHAIVHMNEPSTLFPKTSWALFAVTDSTLSLEESRRCLALAESYAKSKGATKYLIDTERSTRAFERAYGLHKTGDIMEKKLTETSCT